MAGKEERERILYVLRELMVENVPSGRLLIGGSPRAGTTISCGNTTTHLINKALERC